MASILNLLLGRNQGTFTLTPQDVSASGAFSDNAAGAQSVAGTFKNYKVSSQNTLVADGPTAYRQATHVIEESMTSFEIECSHLGGDVWTSSTTNSLLYYGYQFDYFKLILAVSGVTETIFFVVENIEHGTEGKGARTIKLTGKTCAISASGATIAGTNPAFA